MNVWPELKWYDNMPLTGVGEEIKWIEMWKVIWINEMILGYPNGLVIREWKGVNYMKCKQPKQNKMKRIRMNKMNLKQKLNETEKILL